MCPRLVPYGEIELLKAEVNRLIELLLRTGERGAGWHPAVDVMEEEGGMVVQVELPGVRGEDVEVGLKDRTLIVRGAKRRLDREPVPRRFHLMERFIGSFELTVELPEPADPRGARASLEDGVLTVRLPRLLEKRHRVHPISVVENREEGRDDG